MYVCRCLVEGWIYRLVGKKIDGCFILLVIGQGYLSDCKFIDPGRDLLL